MTGALNGAVDSFTTNVTSQVWDIVTTKEKNPLMLEV